MDDILFTCAGTSDPVRGNRDGGILHIMRYYHPKRVYLFLSQQIADLEAQDHRFEKTFQHMQEYCAAHGVVYQPELIIHNSGLDDVSKIDLVEEPLLEYFTSAAVENPNCRILLNLSSGTPQMKTLMQFLSVDSPYHVLGVQVDGPQKKKGEKDPPRTDDRMYNVDYELETNYDDEPDCLPEGERRNRTSEPEMFAIKHQRHRHQLLKLLERQDYDAMLDMSQNLPKQLQTLLQHLNARNNLQSEEAYKLSKELTDLGFPLYPAMKSDSRYRDLSEYYLLLRNLQLTGRYSEFVLRLNPFLTELLFALLSHTEFAPYLKRGSNRIFVTVDALSTEKPALMKKLQAEMGKPYISENFSVLLGVSMVLVVNMLSNEQQNFLRACNALNTTQRNPTAHQLHAVLEDDIKHDCCYVEQYDSAEILQKLGELLVLAYPDVCDKSLFTIYDRCNKYIRDCLQLSDEEAQQHHINVAMSLNR